MPKNGRSQVVLRGFEESLPRNFIMGIINAPERKIRSCTKGFSWNPWKVLCSKAKQIKVTR